MVDFLSRLSGANATQHTQTNSAPRIRMTAGEEVRLQDMYAKKVTNEDVENAMNEPNGRNAVTMLVKKSPIGFTKPDLAELTKSGYTINYKGEFSGPGGSGKFGKPAEDGSVNVTYKTEKFEQNMIYDKNGQVQRGTLIIRDDFGNIERHLDFVMQENGKMTVVQ